MFRLVIGAAAGVLIGAAIGYFGKARGGTCPLMCNPWGGAIFGAIVGMVVAYSMGGRVGTEPESYKKITSVSSPAEFKTAVLDAGKPVLVDFYTDWCTFCKQIAPTIGALSREYAGKVEFVKVNGDLAGELVRKYGIQGYPTVLVFYGQDKFHRLEGAQDESDYRHALDDAVRNFQQGREAQARSGGEP
ncbi:MAG: DUF6132 family protein [Phycisphaerae bacterium]